MYIEIYRYYPKKIIKREVDTLNSVEEVLKLFLQESLLAEISDKQNYELIEQGDFSFLMENDQEIAYIKIIHRS